MSKFVKCPGCKSQVPQGDTNCRMCGAVLDVVEGEEIAARPCSRCDVMIPAEQVNCPVCYPQMIYKIGMIVALVAILLVALVFILAV